MDNDEKIYRQWIRRVRVLVRAKHGLSLSHFAGYLDFAGMYREGLKPYEAVKEAGSMTHVFEPPPVLLEVD